MHLMEMVDVSSPSPHDSKLTRLQAKIKTKMVIINNATQYDQNKLKMNHYVTHFLKKYNKKINKICRKYVLRNPMKWINCRLLIYSIYSEFKQKMLHTLRYGRSPIAISVAVHPILHISAFKTNHNFNSHYNNIVYIY